MRKISKKKLLLAGVLSLLVILLTMFWHRLTANPAGRYIEDKIGYAGLSYFEFKDEKVFLVMSEGHDRVGGKVAENALFATYTLQDGKWVLKTVNGGEPMTLDTRLLSIRLIHPSGHVYEIPRMWTIGDKVIRLHKLKI